jgi:hypothetical protein
MLSTAKKNLNYLKSRLSNYLNAKSISYRQDDSIAINAFKSLNESVEVTPSKISEINKMSQQKNIIQFALKALIIFALVFFFIILPIKSASNKAIEKFNKNQLVKIISLDFIDNPLTFIRLAEYYFESGKMGHVKLYVEYADSLMAKASYPIELKQRLEKIRKKLIAAELLATTKK